MENNHPQYDPVYRSRIRILETRIKAMREEIYKLQDLNCNLEYPYNAEAEKTPFYGKHVFQYLQNLRTMLEELENLLWCYINQMIKEKFPKKPQVNYHGIPTNN